jgi:hypothetical protein
VLLWVAGVLAALVLVGAAVVGTFAVQFSGGWDDVLDLSKPQPGDPDVVAARLVGAEAAEAEVALLSRQVVLPAMAGARVALPAPTGPDAAPTAGQGGPGDRSTGSFCDIGQHNWKIDDPYDLVCREVRREILAGRTQNWSTDLRAIHAALLAAGYAPIGDSLTDDLKLREGAAPAPIGSGTRSADQPSAPPVPYTAAWYGRDGLTVEVSTGLNDIAPADQPNLTPGEYGLALQVTKVSYEK